MAMPIAAPHRWTADAVRALRRDCDLCLAADGAWAKARSAGVAVDAVVGDLDSLSPAERADLDRSSTRVVAYPQAKDWTDLELAIDHALRHAPARMVIYGALGGRIDHTITNLHLLERGLAAGVPIEIVSPTDTVRLIDRDLALAAARVGDPVSLVPITEWAQVRTQGLEYELHDERLFRGASRGVSNVVRELPVRVFVAEGRLLVVHTHETEGGAT